jgi:hypothetical protein
MFVSIIPCKLSETTNGNELQVLKMPQILTGVVAYFKATVCHL